MMTFDSMMNDDDDKRREMRTRNERRRRRRGRENDKRKMATRSCGWCRRRCCCHRDLFFDVMSLIGMCPTHLWWKWRRWCTQHLRIRFDGIVDRPVRSYNFKSYSALICSDLRLAHIKQTGAGSSVEGGWSRTTQNDLIAAKHRQTNKQMPQNRQKKATHEMIWPLWARRWTNQRSTQTNHQREPETHMSSNHLVETR